MKMVIIISELVYIETLHMGTFDTANESYIAWNESMCPFPRLLESRLYIPI